MCGAPDQDTLEPVANGGPEAVIQGRVLRDGTPLGGAYVRLLDGTGEFTAEVQASATGQFRFYAAAGEWTLRTLAPGTSPVDTTVTAAKGATSEVEVLVPA
ncbi:MAG: hypothetical protein JWN17_3275 [Frankiales bacterium]|nr:hypothetical protein [Frankiales bacterium]